MNTTMLGLLSVGLLSGALTAQRLIAYDPLAGLATELQPPTALLPTLCAAILRLFRNR